MAKEKDLIANLNPKCFWDVDLERLDPHRSKRLIIERVFSLGSVEEMVAVIRYYGWSEADKILSRINYLDPKTLNFVAKVFDRPLASFICYTRKQSARPHWSS
jgi:hypothetical protein